MPSLTANAGTAAVDASAGTVAWNNKDNAIGAANGTFASNVMSGGVEQTETQYLVLTGFDFSAMPAEAIIQGILFEALCLRANANLILDAEIRPVLAGVITGSDLKTADPWTQGVFTYRPYGSSTSLLGLPAPLLGSQIKDGNFGLAIRALVPLGQGLAGPRVDHCRCTPTWRLPTLLARGSRPTLASAGSRPTLATAGSRPTFTTTGG